MHDGWRSEEMRHALDLCLACKACRTECPVNVDMATYKAEFLSHHFSGRVRPREAYATGLIYWWARVASKAPRLVNILTSTPGLRDALKLLAGVARERTIPRFAPETLRSWFDARQGNGGGESGDGDGASSETRTPELNALSVKQPTPPPLHVDTVILWPDTFNNFLTPGPARAAVDVLERAGYEVVLPSRPLCCGRPLYDFGMLDTAQRLWKQTLDELRPHLRRGTPIVGVEPSCIAAFRDELPNLFPNDEDAQRLSQSTYLLSEFLLRQRVRVPTLNRTAIVQGHCHHDAVMQMDSERAVLDAMGLDFEILDSGCCGMAGPFGFSADKYEISMRIGERVLLPRVRAAATETFIVANGYSCREQIAQTTDRRALHLAEIIVMAQDHGPEGPPAGRPEDHRPHGRQRERTPQWSSLLRRAASRALPAIDTITTRTSITTNIAERNDNGQHSQ